jgi:hypothetical protein
LQGLDGALKRITQHPFLLISDRMECIDCGLQRLDIELDVAAGSVLARGTFGLPLRLKDWRFPAAELRSLRNRLTCSAPGALGSAEVLGAKLLTSSSCSTLLSKILARTFGIRRPLRAF